jgi:hypothetical protein
MNINDDCDVDYDDDDFGEVIIYIQIIEAKVSLSSLSVPFNS